MSLRDSMVQRREPIHIRRVDGTLAFLEEDLDNSGRANSRGTVQRELAVRVLDSGAAFVGDESADGGDVGFGGCEVEGVLEGLVGVSKKGKEKGKDNWCCVFL